MCGVAVWDCAALWQAASNCALKFSYLLTYKSVCSTFVCSFAEYNRDMVCIVCNRCRIDWRLPALLGHVVGWRQPSLCRNDVIATPPACRSVLLSVSHSRSSCLRYAATSSHPTALHEGIEGIYRVQTNSGGFRGGAEVGGRPPPPQLTGSIFITKWEFSTKTHYFHTALFPDPASIGDGVTPPQTSPRRLPRLDPVYLDAFGVSRPLFQNSGSATANK